MDNTTFLYLI
jgi:hypothetical protein